MIPLKGTKFRTKSTFRSMTEMVHNFMRIKNKTNKTKFNFEIFISFYIHNNIQILNTDSLYNLPNEHNGE